MTTSFAKNRQMLKRPPVCKSKPRPPPPVPIPVVLCLEDLPKTAAQSDNGGANWTNINNIKLEDGLVARAGNVKDERTWVARAFNFMLVWPVGFGVVKGVEITASVNASGSGVVENSIAEISTNGGVTKRIGSETKINPAVIGTDFQTLSWGGVNDLWGTALGLVDVEATSFAARVMMQETDGSNATCRIDWIKVKVCVGLA